MASTTPSSVKVNDPAPRSVSNPGKQSQQPSSKTKKGLPWKTLLGLGVILVELWLNTGIIWGVFMLLWAIMGIGSGQTYILEILDRKAHPILFWFTIHLWLLIAAFFFMGNKHVYAFCQALVAKLGMLFS